MRYILALLILGIISCNPKQKNKITQDIPQVNSENNSSTEKELSSGWNNVKITEIEVEGYYPRFLSSSESIIFSSASYIGLWVYNLKDKTKSELTNARGAGYNPLISTNTIIYEVKSKKTTYEKFNLETNNTSAISEVKDRQSLQKYNSTVQKAIIATVSDDLNSVVFYENGEKIKSISPQDFKNIIHASFSPNKDLILIEVSGRGGFIVDKNGEIIHELGELDNPSWVNDHEILYSKVKDDGMTITAGDIFIKNISTQEEFNISAKFSGILENPQPNNSGDQVIANTPEGKIVVISKN